MKKPLREHRLERGLTQFELAVATGVGLVSIHHWEAMKFRPRPRYLRKLAEVLEVEEADIIVRDPTPGRAPLISSIQDLQEVGQR